MKNTIYSDKTKITYIILDDVEREIVIDHYKKNHQSLKRLGLEKKLGSTVISNLIEAETKHRLPVEEYNKIFN